jgi:hypothetical protein
MPPDPGWRASEFGRAPMGDLLWPVAIGVSMELAIFWSALQGKGKAFMNRKGAKEGLPSGQRPKIRFPRHQQKRLPTSVQGKGAPLNFRSKKETSMHSQGDKVGAGLPDHQGKVGAAPWLRT